jgi:hypothetical protein
LQPSQVGREYPLSAEKLSPILAFYSVADLDAGIDLCRRLLEFGGTGHTCAIHSRDEAAAIKFGQSMPAFRVCVNTSAVHGSIGYSTNLFPALTLGCGSPGGNITSDNIGPQHLLNVKRIAWESRAVEHRSIPADKRMDAPRGMEATAAKAMSAAAGSRTYAPVQGPACGANTGRTLETASSGSSSDVVSEIVGRVFASASTNQARTPPSSTASSGAAPASAFSSLSLSKAVPTVVPFVSESDVREALAHNEKIYIGRKTIVTPSARDLGNAHDIFVETGS